MTKNWKGKRILLLALVLAMLISLLPPTTLPVYSAGVDETQKVDTAAFKKYIGCDAWFTGLYTPLTADPETVGNPISIQPFDTAPYMSVQLVIADCYYDEAYDALWYKVQAAPGHTLPSTMVQSPWVFQDNVIDSWNQPSLNISEPETITGTVTDSEGKEQTITVTGGLPEGAELQVSVPKIDGEQLPNVFDIKVLIPDENGEMVEWQPFKEGKAVTISIPVHDHNVKSVNVHHFIDHKDAIHDGVEYWPLDGVAAEVLEILGPAIEASGQEDHVAVERFEGIAVVNGFAKININSFSIYELNNQKVFVESDEEEYIEFDNVTSNAPNTYHATPGTEFILRTNAFVVNDPYNDNGKYFNAEDGKEYIIAGEEEWDYGFLNLTKYRKVKIKISDDAPAGSKLTIRFQTKGSTSKNVLATIIVVRPVQIKYDANLPEGVTPSDMPDDRIKYSDEDDRRVYTDANEAKFALPTDKIPTAVNKNDSADTYVFKGWSTTRLGDVDFYEWDGTKFSPGNFTPTQDLTLYAIWERGKCEVIFDDNNGTGKKVSYTVTYGEEVTAPAKPSRDGYVFLGWCASLKGDSTRYFPATDDQPADKIQIKSDVVMYALWGVKLDIITIGGSLSVQKDNEGKFTKIEADNDYGFEVKSAGNDITTYYIVVPEHSYASAYFRFTPTTAGNTITIDHVGSDMEYLKVIDSDKLSGDIRISAVGMTTETKITFTALDKYVISFVTNGGSPLSSVAVDMGSGLNLGDYKTEQAGYGNVEWYLTSDFSGQPVTKLENITQNVTVYAKWTANSYVITYKDGGLETTASYTIKDILNLACSKPGYTFKGWKVTTADGNWELNRTYTDAVTGMYGNVTLTAQWEVNNYKVIWDVDGSKTEQTYPYGENIPPIADPQKDGWEFVGWYTENNEKVTFPMTMPVGGITLYAKWEQALTSLTIDVVYPNGENYAIDGDQAFLFDVVGVDDGVNLTVAILKDGTATIDGLTIGNTYSVIVKNSWSWRYDVTVGDDAYENITSPEFDETTLSVRFVLGVDSKVTFTMERVEDQWLDGNDWYELNLQN